MTVHIGVRKSCLSAATMLLLEGQTEEGLFSMSKGTFFMSKLLSLTHKRAFFVIHTVWYF